MKKLLRIFIVIFFTFLITDSFAQRGSLFPWGKTLEQLVGGLSTSTESDVVPTMSCTPRDQPGECTNFISNNNFTPSGSYNPNNAAMYQDPFTVAPPAKPGYVPEWNAAQGTPNIDDVYARFAGTPTAPPSPATGYAFMYASNYDGSTPRNEGIVQKIPSLTTGHKYGLSFFKMISRLLPDFPLATGNLNIVLMHCSDYSSIYPQPDIFTTPDLPVHAQQVYCETSLSNTAWQQKLISFVADEDYDMIWIFSKGNSGEGYAINFAYPELKDVTGFTAGSDPAAPTPDNCTVTIGPTTPNACTFTNSVFTWHGPHGQTITAAPDQQLQVDASDPDNVGTWALTMTITGEVAANNTCGQILSASVNVSACEENSWPKAYGSIQESLGLIKSENGNVFLSATKLSFDPNTYYNHVGLFPSVSEVMAIQYNEFGTTTWLKDDRSCVFAFKSGVVQMECDLCTPQNQFVDGSTGTSATAPLTLIPFESVVGEPNSGGFITTVMDFTNPGGPLTTFRAHLSSITSTSAGTGSYLGKYNPVTNNLMVYDFPNSLIMYHFDGTSINYVSTLALNISAPYTHFQEPPLVDNQDRVYIIRNGVLKYFDGTGNLVDVTISGFNNYDLQSIQNVDNYTSNICLVYNKTDHYLYKLDLNASTYKKVACTDVTDNWFDLKYIFDNDNVFLAGRYFDACQIGTQSLPQLPVYPLVKVFITKLNITNDFTLKNTGNPIVLNSKTQSTLKVVVSPNPASNILGLNILEDVKQATTEYSIIVTNRVGKKMIGFKNHTPNSKININSWEKGVYYIQIVNSKGEKTSTSFIKI